MNKARNIYIISLFIFLSLATISNVLSQVFLPDDPIWNDPDQMNLPLPKSVGHSEYYDFYNNTFLSPGKQHKGSAQNVNTLGEVPNSSWYTNRHYWFPMDIEALKHGANEGEGISSVGTWEIIQGKSQGITPGFTVRDKNGNIYLIKFDPPDYPELATGAEMICTKFFHVLGYHVPENYLIRFKPNRLVLSPKATTRDAIGRKKPLTERIVEQMLAKAHQDPEGYHRAIASKFLSGKPIGPFIYYGTRPDDPNDIYPHEIRRELRGLRVFCAWLNHDDSRAINSLDMIVEEDGKKFVRHHLIDFGSTLGSGSVTIQALRAGNEYVIQPESIFGGLFSFGLWIRPWAKIQYPDYPSIGRIESDYFDPVKWKPEYPNPAFQNCDADDAFWAAKQVMNFSDEEIRAIVSTAEYSDPAAEQYLIHTLIKRRNKIGRAYLFFSGGLDKFKIDNYRLVLEDLLKKYEIDTTEKTRKITWAEFDNNTGKIGNTLTELETSDLQINIPSSKAEFLVATIETPELGVTRIFIRNSSVEYEVVGIKRR